MSLISAWEAMLGGDVIMSDMQVFNFKSESNDRSSIILEDGDNLLITTPNHLLTLNNIKVSDEFKRKHIDATQKYRVDIEWHEFPKGRNLPRRKRIRNKWLKKYRREQTIDTRLVEVV